MPHSPLRREEGLLQPVIEAGKGQYTRGVGFTTLLTRGTGCGVITV